MIGVLTFFYGILTAAVYIFIAVFLFRRLNKMPLGLRISIIVIILGITGLCLIFGAAILNSHNLDGKTRSGIIKSPAEELCVNVHVVFDKDKVLIITTDAVNIKLKDKTEIPANSSASAVLVDKFTENQKEIRLIESSSNVLLKLNIVDYACPEFK